MIAMGCSGRAKSNASPNLAGDGVNEEEDDDDADEAPEVGGVGVEARALRRGQPWLRLVRRSSLQSISRHAGSPRKTFVEYHYLDSISKHPAANRNESSLL